MKIGRKIVCVRCGKVVLARDYEKRIGAFISDECSHLFFDRRDRVGLALGRRLTRSP
jgi:hypothetical protein